MNQKKKIDLAVVIPTLNEEYYIGELLDSITKQTVQPKEIVVVDALSQDRTIDEIKKRQRKLPQLKVYQLPKSTISKQRNFGVLKTRATHLLFLDADMTFKDKNTLNLYFQEVLEDKPDLASAFNLPTTEYWKDKAFFTAMNLLFVASRPIWPMTTAMNIYANRKVFKAVGGFDESIRVGEDFELVQRAVKYGHKFTFLKKTKLHTSPRRIEKEGRRKFILKMTVNFFQIILRGYKHIDVEYEFGKFKEEKRIKPQ